jgi:hypothetical protein
MPDSERKMPSLARRFEIDLRATATAPAGLVADKPPAPAPPVMKSDGDEGHATEGALVDGQGGGSEAIRIAMPHEGGGERSAAADRNTDGSVTEFLAGRPPRTRESELRAARLLVERLNLDGGAWLPPVSCDEERARTSIPEDGVDCRSRGPGGVLHIQVTTPEVQLWGALARAGQVTRHSPSVRELVNAIWTAVEKKHLVAGRQCITLALDATDCPAYSFRSVVAVFQGKFGLRAAAVGYESIWMIGPSADLVQRLDIAPI